MTRATAELLQSILRDGDVVGVWSQGASQTYASLSDDEVREFVADGVCAEACAVLRSGIVSALVADSEIAAAVLG